MDEEFKERVLNSIKFLEETRSKNHKNEIIMRAETFIAMQEKLESMIDGAASKIMFKLGYDIGTQNITGIKKDYLKKAVKILKGKYWINKPEIIPNKVCPRIRFEDTFISKFHKKYRKCTCSFIAGFLTVFSNKDRDCEMEETKCIAKGDDYCEFKARR